MPAIDWEHAPEFSKMSYEELEAHAMRDWYDLAYANEFIRQLESLVRDMHAEYRALVDTLVRLRGQTVTINTANVMRLKTREMSFRCRAKELGITGGEGS